MQEEEFNNWYDNLPILAYWELDDEILQKYMIEILNWKKNEIFISTEIPNSSYENLKKLTTIEYWLILVLLSDCIDYGSSPRGGGLTDFGRKVLKYLEENHK